MSKLATSKTSGFNRKVIQETLASPNIEADEVYSLEVVLESSWMSPILCYLQYEELPLDEEEARVYIALSTICPARCTILFGKYYKIRRASPLL